MNHLFLVIAVVFEVIATSTLKATEGFTRFWPSVVTVAGYACAFYFLSLPVRTIPVGIVYALWCGIGIVLVTLVGWVVLKQALDTPALIGMGLILAGVIVINLFSKTVAH
jgi:small multidrug resistance pump